MDSEIFIMDGINGDEHDTPHDADAIAFDPSLSSLDLPDSSFLLEELLDPYGPLPYNHGPTFILEDWDFTSFQEADFQVSTEVLELEQQYSWCLYKTNHSDILDDIDFVSPAELSGDNMQLHTESAILADPSTLAEQQSGTWNSPNTDIEVQTPCSSINAAFPDSTTACPLLETTLESVATPSPTKAKRTRIDAKARNILDMYFAMNAYPSNDIISALTTPTSLPEATIRTWFANTRSRRSVSSGKVNASQ
jgi:hypothetical protein